MDLLRKRSNNAVNKHSDRNSGCANAAINDKKQTSWYSSATMFLLPRTKQDVKKEDPQNNEKAVTTKKKIKKICIVLAVTMLVVNVVMRICNSLGVEQRMAAKAFANKYIMTYGDDLFSPVFQDEGYLDDYPYLKVVEDNYETIREEMEELIKVNIPKLADYGEYVSAAEEGADWRTFFFRLGRPIPENRKWAPKTYDIINTATNTNDIIVAMASILMPHNGVKPHWGYYKGFTRYHYGVIIPDNNAENKTCILVNKHHLESDPATYQRVEFEKDYSMLANTTETDTYYWKNRKGVVFDDTYLHQAKNDADGVRVVLFFDLLRKYPRYMWYKGVLNRLIMNFVFRINFLTTLQKEAIFKGSVKDPSATQ